MENVIKVNKHDFHVFDFANGYFGICKKDDFGANCVWGGDSAFEDCYIEKLANDIFQKWDGSLHYIGGYGYDGYIIDTDTLVWH